MNRKWVAAFSGLAASAVVVALGAAASDFGLTVQQALVEQSLELFGVFGPLKASAAGPFTGANPAQAVKVADSLQVSVASTAVSPGADMIALWPDDENPIYAFVCIEGGTSGPGVQRVDLSGNPATNATTIVVGLSSCDPIHRTAWGTIVAAEEAGTTGGAYEIMNPAGSFVTPVVVTNRSTGATSDPARVVKRKAVGSLSFEGMVFLPDGTMYYGDELRPGTTPAGSGSPGGAIYKFVPQFPFAGGSPITNPALSPLASGSLFGMRIGNAGDYGQGTEIGSGVWVPIDPAAFTDANGNIILRNAQTVHHFTGYYRPEDYDLDPVAFAKDEIRFCGANTGRVSNGGGSVVETAATYGEVVCVTDDADAEATGGAIPTVTRFVAGNPQAEMFDNVDFQPRTGNLVILEDGEVEVVTKKGTTELRGNDVWMCLPDGRDDDVQTDGCIRIVSLKDTSSEPTGWIFTASGRAAYVNLQHRSVGTGALLKITGFQTDK